MNPLVSRCEEGQPVCLGVNIQRLVYPEGLSLPKHCGQAGGACDTTAVDDYTYWCHLPVPFARNFQRKIGKQLQEIDESPEDGGRGDSVSGQVRI